MKIKLLVFTVFTYLGINNVNAQSYSVSGKISAGDQAAMGYSSITLKALEKGKSATSVSDSSGFFSIKVEKGDYLISIGRLGHQFYKKEIQVEKDIDLGKIVIESPILLEQVLVEGKGKAFERKPDRLVFNVERIPGVDGLNVSEILSNTPMLRTDDAGVSIVGKSGVSVMVNERIINLSGTDLIQYLNSLRVSDVSKIEVITTPPAKYDAQGNSGLINIVLKKKDEIGFNGSVNSTYMQRRFAGISNSGSLNFQSSKALASLGLSQYDVAYRATENLVNEGKGLHTDRRDLRKDFNDGFGLNLKFDYKINNRSNIGIVYNGTMGHTNMDIKSTVDFYGISEIDSTLFTSSQHRKKLKNHAASAYFDLNLDTLGRKLSFIGNFLTNSPESPLFFETTNINTGRLTKVKNQSDNDYKIYSIQSDLILPTSWAQFEVGAKHTSMHNNSNVVYYNDKGGELIMDESKSNLFNYNENISALYLSGSKKINDKLSFKAGLRYEYTAGEGVSKTLENKNKASYDNLFPTGYLSYNLNEKNSFSLAYSKRINRPNMGMLNPFRWYTNPYFYSSGNPLLGPSCNNNLELGYIYNGNLSFTIYHQIMNNGSSQVLTIDPPFQVFTWENHLKTASTGMNLSYFFSKLNFLQSSIFGDLFYSKGNSTRIEVLPQNGFNAFFQLNNTFFLTKNKNATFILNYWHNLAGYSGNSHSEPSANLKSGFNIQILDKKLQFSVTGEDILKQNKSRGISFYNDYTQSYDNYYNAQRLNISVTYRFGQSGAKTIFKDTKFSERNRAN